MRNQDCSETRVIFSRLFYGCALVLLCAGWGRAAENVAASAVRNENIKLVRKALSDAALPAADTVWYAVPAMSAVMRLDSTYPQDGRLNGDLRIVAAQGEFEPASFQLYSFKNQKNVTFKIPTLTGPGGATISADQLDLKVVKVWYQNGNAWTSYFADVGLKLVPELLLNDENIIKVDTDEVANYARIDYPDGAKYAWISAPRELDTGAFKSVTEPFADAETLQPVVLEAGRFKQFFLTAHVPEGQTPGTYKGTIAISSGRRTLTKMPVSLRVLPFELPLPRPYFDLESNFVVSVMCGIRLKNMISIYGGDRVQGKKAYRNYLINQRNHGILHPCVDQDPENFALIKELGFPTKPLIGGRGFAPWVGRNFGGRLTFDNYMTFKKAARYSSAFYKKYLGHNDVLITYGDEQGTAFVATHRNFFKYYQQYGMKIGCAGHEALLQKGGYTYELYPMGGYPDAVEKIRPWREIGDKYVGFYAGQHTGSENPQFIRRQNGMLGYLSNLNLVFNYEFATGPWNDLAHQLYKPMVLAYLNSGGLVDTLQWEGFREGIDDIRYATKLKLLVKEAVESGNVDRKLQGKKALQYLALLDGAEMDLNVVRAEMINYILKLISMR